MVRPRRLYGQDHEGKPKYYYGGDFGESPKTETSAWTAGLPRPHPSPSLKEFKNVIRPLRITAGDLEKGEFLFRNILDFTNTKDLLTVKYNVVQDGVVVFQGEISDAATLDLAPHGTKTIVLPCALPTAGTVSVDFTLVQKPELALTHAGHILGTDQVIVSESAESPRLAEILSADSRPRSPLSGD